MSPAVSPSFPRLLRRAWSLTDAASRCDRRCDALDTATAHQKLNTIRGAYWLCSVTGQMHRDDVVPNMQGLYDEAWERKITEHHASNDQRHEHDVWLRRVAPYRQSGRLFEVGAGRGGLLKAAADAGWRVEGNDISQVACDHARRLSGVDVALGSMETIDLEAGVYDVILCNNVFEHLEQPRMVLRKLSAALRPGGVLFLQTLNGQSLSLRLQPTGWMYYGQGHLFVPTIVSMTHYIKAAGLKPIKFETHGFRSSATHESDESRRKRRRIDKFAALIAARIGRGHRVRYLLKKT